jgi:aspartyl-tRNA(Asn)/glutamyl-tRNA(Gln) amidotransferase subunit B
MRTKENAKDYRYFPEPDLPVFCPDGEFLRSVEEALTELPLPRMKRLVGEYGIRGEQADLLCEEKAEADYFEAAVGEAVRGGLEKKDAADRIAKWLLSDIKHILSRERIPPGGIFSLNLNPRRLASLIVSVARGQVSLKNAKQAMEAVLAEDRDPELIIRERGWEQLSDPAEIARAVEAVREREAAVFAEIRAVSAGGGEASTRRRNILRAYLVGKVLAATGGRADPKIAGAQIEAAIRLDR